MCDVELREVEMSGCEVGFWLTYLILAAVALIDLATAPTVERKGW